MTLDPKATEPDYIYNPDDWEETYGWRDRDLLVDDLVGELWEPKKFATLINGPAVWVKEVVVTKDDNGDPDETEIRWRVYKLDTRSTFEAELLDAVSMGEAGMNSAMEVCGGRRKTGRSAICVGASPGFRRGLARRFQRASGSFKQNISVHDGRWREACLHGATRRCRVACIPRGRAFILSRCAFPEGLDCASARRPPRVFKGGDRAGSKKRRWRVSQQNRQMTVQWEWPGLVAIQTPQMLSLRQAAAGGSGSMRKWAQVRRLRLLRVLAQLAGRAKSRGNIPCDK